MADLLCDKFGYIQNQSLYIYQDTDGHHTEALWQVYR